MYGVFTSFLKVIDYIIQTSLFALGFNHKFQHPLSIVSSVVMYKAQVIFKSSSFLLVNMENLHDQLEHELNLHGELFHSS